MSAVAVSASSGRLCSVRSRHAQCGRSTRHSVVPSARILSSSPAGSAAGRNLRPVARSASAVLSSGLQSRNESPCEDFMVNIRNTTMLTGSLGQPLSKEEQRSLLKCLDSARLGVDSCLVDGLTGLYDHLMAYIEEVSATQEDDLELVEGAMLLLEQLSIELGIMDDKVLRPRPGSAPPSPDAPRPPLPGFTGRWQMLATTGGGWPTRLQYVPVLELLEVSQCGQRFTLESKNGPLYTLARGDMAWGGGPGPYPWSTGSGTGRGSGSSRVSLSTVVAPNYVRYHVSELRVELFGRTFGPLPAPSPDNDLLVFALGRSIAIARSTAGAITLMGRPA